MNVTETSAEGLKHEFRIVVPADEIEQKMQTRLRAIGQRVKLPGFRPGKVPLKVLKQRYGRAVIGEVLEEAVQESSQQTLTERGIRPAGTPHIEVKQFDDGSDLEYTMALEKLPEVELPDLSALELERPVAEVEEDAVAQALGRLAEHQKQYVAPAEPRPAQDGDRVVIDYKLLVEGEDQPEMGGSDFEVDLGETGVFAAVAAALVGASPGQHLTVDTAFPEDDPRPEIAGKAGVFEIDVKEVREPQPMDVGEDLAKAFGFESLEQMRGAVRTRIEQDYRRLSRLKVKRQLLDTLAAQHRFEVPQGLVDREFDSIWKQVERARESGEKADPDLDRPEDELRAEYREIAERRVRLGLILSEIGRQNNIEVTREELNQAIWAEARQFPGYERQFAEMLAKNSEAMDSVRAPLLEEKVVDFILEMAQVTDRPVAVEDLMRDPDQDKAAGVAGGDEESGSAGA